MAALSRQRGEARFRKKAPNRKLRIALMGGRAACRKTGSPSVRCYTRSNTKVRIAPLAGYIRETERRTAAADLGIDRTLFGRSQIQENRA